MRDNWAHASVECLKMGMGDLYSFTDLGLKILQFWHYALLCLCESGASLVSVVDPQESLFIEQNVEFLQDSAKSFWIGLYKNHESMHKVIAVITGALILIDQTTLLWSVE